MKQRYVQNASHLFLAMVVMLMAILPVQAAMPRTAAAQSADAVAPSNLSEVDQSAGVLADVVLEEEIVYVGDDERIYVLDTHHVDDDTDNPLVKWVSPDDDWRSVDVGDFNNDGDMEIVAVGGSKETGKLSVWDPVVRTGESGLQTINDIPWKLLHNRSIPGQPEIVKAGNYDPNIPGDEILYGFKMKDEVKVNEDDEFRTTIIKSGTPNPDGTNWVDHIAGKDDGTEWTFVTSGDLGDGGADEIALLDEDGGEVNVFRLENGFQRILGESSSSNPYRSVAFGDYFEGGYHEVIITRNEKWPDPSLFYYTYFPGDENELRHEGKLEIVSPYPRFSFLADVNNSGDDELFMLRRDSDPRLISRNSGSDYMPALEEELDEDNGYRAGAGGDLNGDGNADVVIIRDDRIRTYTNEGSRWGVEEHVVSAETKVVRTGDLDGGAAGANFAFSVESIEQALESDTSVQNREYSLSNDGTDDVIDFSYTVPNKPSWLTITHDSLQASAARPARFFVSFDAAGLTVGTYNASIVFTAITPVTKNSPLTVPIVLTVQEAQITPNPPAAFFDYYPCEEPLKAMQIDIAIGGTTGLAYNAAIIDRPLLEDAQAALAEEITAAGIGLDGTVTFEGETGNRVTIDLPAPPEVTASGVMSTTWPSNADWVNAVSETGHVPDTITLSVDPAKRGADNLQAVLVLVGDERAGNSPTNVELIPLNFMCSNGRAYLPTVLR